MVIVIFVLIEVVGFLQVIDYNRCFVNIVTPYISGMIVDLVIQGGQGDL